LKSYPRQPHKTARQLCVKKVERVDSHLAQARQILVRCMDNPFQVSQLSCQSRKVRKRNRVYEVVGCPLTIKLDKIGALGKSKSTRALRIHCERAFARGKIIKCLAPLIPGLHQHNRRGDFCVR
jgi:hypothetical protein